MATTLKTGRRENPRTTVLLLVLPPRAWLAFLLMIGFWIVCVVAPFMAWILWRRNRESQAWAMMSAPLLWGFATITVLQFVPG